MNDTGCYERIRMSCRACLNPIILEHIDDGKENQKTVDDAKLSQAPKSLLSPNLCSLFLAFTTFDVSLEVQEFPKQVCPSCLAKLLECESFRKKVLETTNRLCEALKDRQTENAGEEEAMNGSTEHTGCSFIKEEPTYNESQIDPQYFCDVDMADHDESNEELKFDINDNDCLDQLDNDHENDSHDDNEGRERNMDVAMEENSSKVEQERIPENNDDDDCGKSNSSGLHSNMMSPVFERTSENQDSLDSQKDSTNIVEENDGGASVSATEKDSSTKNITSDISDIPITTDPKILNNKKIDVLYCFSCNKQFRFQATFECHMFKEHYGIQKPYPCEKCNKSYSTKKLLDEHIREKCGMEFKNTVQKDNVKYRIVVARGITLKDGYTRECEICGKKLKCARSLGIHMNRHKNVKDHKCPECGVLKTTATELRQHMRVHDENVERFPCPQCPQMFKHKNAVFRHVKSKHEGLKPFACPICPKRFATRNNQICHQKFTHAEGRNFLCQTCYRSFATEKSFIKHKKAHIKISCNLCSRRFMNIKTLAEHQKVHLGLNGYICTTCSHGFFSLEDLQNHTKHLHENSDGDKTESDSKDLTKSGDTEKTTEISNNNNKENGSQKKLKKVKNSKLSLSSSSSPNNKTSKNKQLSRSSDQRSKSTSDKDTPDGNSPNNKTSKTKRLSKSSDKQSKSTSDIGTPDGSSPSNKTSNTKSSGKQSKISPKVKHQENTLNRRSSARFSLRNKRGNNKSRT